jgi:hypothetical protein
MTTASTTATEAPPPPGLLRRGGIALGVALLVNLLVTFAARSAGLAPDLMALNYGPVTVVTTVGVAGATAVYALLGRVVADPDRTFTLVAVVVLAVSLIPNVVAVPTQPGGTVAGSAALGVMHVTTALACVGALTGRLS